MGQKAYKALQYAHMCGHSCEVVLKLSMYCQVLAIHTRLMHDDISRVGELQY